MNNVMAYVVAKDGYNGYGAKIYLLGVFTDKDKALEIVDKERPAYILSIPMDKEFPLKMNHDGNLENDYFLAGYIE